MRKITLLPIAALAVLAACTGAEINQPPIEYTATKPLNEAGRTSFTVRTFLNANGGRTEVSSVACTFKGDGFSSSFVTPAVVIAPNMQLHTPPASVTCRYNGQNMTKVLQPYNKTVNDITDNGASIGAGAGLLGALIGGAIAAASATGRDTSADIWAYPDANVEFNG